MKVKKIILLMLVATSVSSALMVGCTSATPSIDKESYTVEEISEIKKDLSKRISKAIKKGGLRVAEISPDDSFVLSLGNLEYSKNQPKQVLNYSMTKDEKNNKEILDMHCVKDFSNDENLSENDKFLRAIYGIYDSLADTELAYKRFFYDVEIIFNKGEGSIELPNLEDALVEVKKVDDSTKILQLRIKDEFILK